MGPHASNVVCSKPEGARDGPLVMTAADVGQGAEPVSGGRQWNLGLLTTAEQGRRNRRPVDAFFLLATAIVLGYLFVTMAVAWRSRSQRVREMAA